MSQQSQEAEPYNDSSTCDSKSSAIHFIDDCAILTTVTPPKTSNTISASITDLSNHLSIKAGYELDKYYDQHFQNEVQDRLRLVRHSAKAFKHFKNPPQPHMCIRDHNTSGQEIFINVMSWTRIVMPQNSTDPIPLYGGMRVPPSNPRSPPFIYAVMANPDILKHVGRNCTDPEEKLALVELMCDFVEAMNPGLKLARNAEVLKDRDLSGELKDIWGAVQAKREREKDIANPASCENYTSGHNLLTTYMEFGPDTSYHQQHKDQDNQQTHLEIIRTPLHSNSNLKYEKRRLEPENQPVKEEILQLKQDEEKKTITVPLVTTSNELILTIQTINQQSKINTTSAINIENNILINNDSNYDDSSLPFNSSHSTLLSHTINFEKCHSQKVSQEEPTNVNKSSDQFENNFKVMTISLQQQQKDNHLQQKQPPQEQKYHKQEQQEIKQQTASIPKFVPKSASISSNSLISSLLLNNKKSPICISSNTSKNTLSSNRSVITSPAKLPTPGSTMPPNLTKKEKLSGFLPNGYHNMFPFIKSKTSQEKKDKSIDKEKKLSNSLRNTTNSKLLNNKTTDTNITSDGHCNTNTNNYINSCLNDVKINSLKNTNDISVDKSTDIIHGSSNINTSSNNINVTSHPSHLDQSKKSYKKIENEIGNISLNELHNDNAIRGDSRNVNFHVRSDTTKKKMLSTILK